MHGGPGARLTHLFYSYIPAYGYCTVAALRCAIVEGPPPIHMSAEVWPCIMLYAIHTNV